MATARLDIEISADGTVLKVIAADLEETGRAAESAKKKLADLGDTQSELEELFEGTVLEDAPEMFDKWSTAAGATTAGIGLLVGAVVGLVAWVGQGVGKLMEMGDTLGNFQGQTGASVEGLQRLEHVAIRGNSSIETFTGGILKMQQGLENSSPTFAKLNLSITDLKAMEPDQAFIAVAEALRQVDDQNKQVVLGTALFGKQFAEMLPAVRAGMAETADEADRLGKVIGGDTLDAAGELDKSTKTLGMAMETLQLQLAAVVINSVSAAPAIDDMATSVGGLTARINEAEPKLSAMLGTVLRIGNLGGVTNPFAGLFHAARIDELIASDFKADPRPPTPGIMRGPAGVNLDFEGKQARGLLEAEGIPAELERVKAANKQAAEEAVRTAEAARKAWQDAAVKSREIWDQFYEGMRKKGHQAILALANDQDRETARIAQTQRDEFKADVEANIDLEERLADQQDMMEEARARGAANRRAQHQQELADLRELSGALDELGAAVGGAFGMFLSAGAAALAVVHNLDKAVQDSMTSTQKWANALSSAASIITGSKGQSKGRAALSGAMAGAAAGALFGPIGAGIGAVAGGLLGAIFGGKSKEQLIAEKQQAQQLIEERIAFIEESRRRVSEGLSRAAGAMGGITGILGEGTHRVGGLSEGDVASRVERYASKLREAGVAEDELAEKARLRQKELERWGEDMPNVEGGLKIFNAASAEAQATIFTATFWGTVKDKGLLAGIDALSGPFQALKAKLSEGGFDVDKLLGGMGSLFDKLAEPGPARAAVQAVDSLKESLQGLAQADMLTQGAFSAFGVAAQDALRQATEGGLSSGDALSAIRPLLAEIVQAQQEYGLTVDASTQALIDQSIAADGAFPVDPILQMRDAVRELINEIRVMNGLPARDWGPPPPGPGGPANPEDTHLEPGDFKTSAAGFGPKQLARDTMFLAHQGEHVLIIPKGHAVGFTSAAAGYGMDYEGGGLGWGSGSGGGMGGGSSDSGDGGIAWVSPRHRSSSSQGDSGGWSDSSAVVGAIESLEQEIKKSNKKRPVEANLTYVAAQGDTPMQSERNARAAAKAVLKTAEARSEIADIVEAALPGALRSLGVRRGA